MSGKGLTVNPLLVGDHEVYDRLAGKYGCIFDSIRWTSLFETGIRRFGIYDAGENLRGGFCVFEERKFGLKILRNPPFSPSSGPFFEYRANNEAARTQEQRDVVEAMARFLSEDRHAVLFLALPLDTQDTLPFYWRGYKVIPNYTYRIFLNHSKEQILRAMSPDRRKNITKAIKDGLQVREAKGTDDLRWLFSETFTRQSKAFPKQAMSDILSSLPPGSNSYAFLTLKNGETVAGAYVVYDNRTAYYLMGGYRNENGHHGAGALAFYHAILRAQEMGLEVFDFEGSIIPPIERYFRGFGGRLTPYFTVNKAWLPLELALKFVKRQIF
jgi:nitroreductase